MATISKSKCNTSPIAKPSNFGDVVHFDIVYGTGTAIRGYRYALWLVDRATQFAFQYPLKTLKEEELLCTMRLFHRDCWGKLPARMLADIDFKLIRCKIAKFLEGTAWQGEINREQCSVSGAPTGRQNKKVWRKSNESM
eukprot:4713278-Ditylum_brightwellii.AAC.1